MDLKDYIQLALKSEAVEMVFAPGEAPRCRREKEWEIIKSDAPKNYHISPAQTMHLACPLCTE